MFDFLFLVGRLEEQGHNGDSAETALLACNEKPDEVCVLALYLMETLVILKKFHYYGAGSEVLE